MARKQVVIEGGTVHVVRCTVQRRWLLRPQRRLDRQIEGIVADAQRRQRVAMHAIVVMPDRIEMVMTPRTRADVAELTAEVFGRVALAVSQVHGWRGPVWEDGVRVAVAPVAESETMDRVIDVMAAPVRERLVETPEAWPGVSSARVRDGGEVGGIAIVPVRAYAALPAAARNALVRQRYQQLAAEGFVRTNGAPVLGRKWLLSRDPTLPDPRSPTHALVAAFDLVYPAA